ncbi:hypothetical protein PHYBLDRAFT_162332 [Phycomyces blakesleeanus NRRL 1555(-)]|uniref:Uncharacterized protein n=2 Tax=Phycomyces blakesleeanus TaxID=4837 RepID=A0A162Y9W9_PHYB8|nr:hypothetical protein PHYBLDRAFT_162332 [Phycomyces blakesleeanus NRRL 1555(-)]OAD79255.1 hypothetical protein PHYBLDRAFT_162332 [Phycomyces blakesleeanus NRRL 1555(-)]|eukprot:XP_018297295.1 hypothetical protein PHYBLDRAFT_162332 [Phycomyces blakesleeanus NRRL 1555(-)]
MIVQEEADVVGYEAQSNSQHQQHEAGGVGGMGGGDPYVDKITSSLWRRAAQIQSTLGSLTGKEDWEEAGRRKELEAQDMYREAQARAEAHEPSWAHGEYERWMGKLEQAVGHVSGDTDMEARARQRVQNGTDEVERATE